MSSTTDRFVRWSPHTAADRDMVADELDAILASHHFRNSKRYPALLKYVVNKTLDGQASQLKERMLGIEVFDRAADYDTSTDPVVRFSASEVRKRIAQFYRERGRDSLLEIDLPVGSYVPEFRLHPPAIVEAETFDLQAHGLDSMIHAAPLPTMEPLASGAMGPQPRWSGRTASMGWSAALLLLLLVVGAVTVHKLRTSTATEKILKPLLTSPGSVQIVIGNGLHEVRTPSDPEHEIIASQLHGAYNRVSVCDAVAVSRIAAILGSQSKPYEVKEADLTSLQDLRQRPAILIGAYNNLWTMRLMEPLRFHFVKDGHGVRIVDTRDPHNLNWKVDYSKSNSATVYDYAIVARYTDATTHGSILIVAGIGAYGTQAASEAVTSPGDLAKLLTGMPRGWEKGNLELVLKTAIINGEAGPATLVSSATW
jgi:hypothetical protein